MQALKVHQCRTVLDITHLEAESGLRATAGVCVRQRLRSVSGWWFDPRFSSRLSSIRLDELSLSLLTNTPVGGRPIVSGGASKHRGDRW